MSSSIKNETYGPWVPLPNKLQNYARSGRNRDNWFAVMKNIRYSFIIKIHCLHLWQVRVLGEQKILLHFKSFINEQL